MNTNVERRVKIKKKTDLAIHHLKNSQNSNFDSFDDVHILDIGIKYSKRVIREMMQIKLNDIVNSRTDVAHLS